MWKIIRFQILNFKSSICSELSLVVDALFVFYAWLIQHKLISLFTSKEVMDFFSKLGSQTVLHEFGRTLG